MRKIIITCLCIILSSINSSFAQIPNNNKLDSTNVEIELKWKLTQNDTLFYETIMTEIERSKFEVDFGGLFGKTTDSTEFSKTFIEHFYQKLQDEYAKSNMITRLSNSIYFQDVLDIQMFLLPKEFSETDWGMSPSDQVDYSSKGAMLRGSIYKTGKLHSFWLKGGQKNIISLFFELPNRPLRQGDTWSLDNVNFIGNDQNFVCKEAEKKNKIVLSEIKTINGETIAVIDYDILEYVSGDFEMPDFLKQSEEKKETVMKFIYKAQAEFSVDKGKWIKYNGIMSLDASGVLTSTQKQKFALKEKMK